MVSVRYCEPDTAAPYGASLPEKVLADRVRAPSFSKFQAPPWLRLAVLKAKVELKQVASWVLSVETAPPLRLKV